MNWNKKLSIDGYTSDVRCADTTVGLHSRSLHLFESFPDKHFPYTHSSVTHQKKQKAGQ